MDEEMAALRKKDTFNVVTIPKERKSIESKYVYKHKLLTDGTLEWKKAWGVAKGFSKIHGTNFEEVYAPIVWYESQWVYLAICAYEGWTPSQFDVKLAFIYGELKENIYM